MQVVFVLELILGDTIMISRKHLRKLNDYVTGFYYLKKAKYI